MHWIKGVKSGLDDFVVRFLLSPVKQAMRVMGYEVGPCRLPLCDMDPTNAEKLYKTLKQYGLISGEVRAGSVTVSGMKNTGNVLRGNV